MLWLATISPAEWRGNYPHWRRSPALSSANNKWWRVALPLPTPFIRFLAPNFGASNRPRRWPRHWPTIEGHKKQKVYHSSLVWRALTHSPWVMYNCGHDSLHIYRSRIIIHKSGFGICFAHFSPFCTCSSPLWSLCHFDFFSTAINFTLNGRGNGDDDNRDKLWVRTAPAIMMAVLMGNLQKYFCDVDHFYGHP